MPPQVREQIQRIEINFKELHPGQLTIAQSPARYRVGSCGRRWGKTELATQESIMVALYGGRVWWVAPTYQMSQPAWRYLRFVASGIPKAAINTGDRMVTMPPLREGMEAGSIQMKSAEDPTHLRGEGLDLVIYDEAAFGPSDAWHYSLEPALLDHNGRALFISTPNGLNWFYDLWYYASSSGDPDWAAFQFATITNPHYSPEAFEKLRRSKLPHVFHQEYLAEFLESGTGVFPKIDEALGSSEQLKPIFGHNYVMGVDLGKLQDATVISVGDLTTMEQVYCERLVGIEYEVQEQRLRQLNDLYNPIAIVIEKNAHERTIEYLRRMKMPVIGFHTTGVTKSIIIEALGLAFANNELRILDIPDQTHELRSFGMERLPSGMIRYRAPGRMHDDYVISLALMWHAMHQHNNPSISRVDVRGLYGRDELRQKRRKYPTWRSKRSVYEPSGF